MGKAETQCMLLHQIDLTAHTSSTVQLVWQQLVQAIECEDEGGVQDCRRKLSKEGFGQEEVEEEIKIARKKYSEECGVSVEYLLSDEFLQLAQERTGDTDPTFHQMKAHFFTGENAIGSETRCPRDGEKGCSLLDTLPSRYRKRSTHFLSWLWGYRLSTIRDALANWMQNDSLEPAETFVSMCFFVNNQYRFLGANSANGCDSLDSVFEESLHRIGRMVLVLDTWDKPSSLQRSWAIFELVTAIQMGLTLKMVFPPDAASDLVQQFHDGETGLQRVTSSLSNLDCRASKATLATDEEKIKSLIEDTIGFAGVDATLAEFMAEWAGRHMTNWTSQDVGGKLRYSGNLCEEVCTESMTSLKSMASAKSEKRGPWNALQALKCKGSFDFETKLLVVL
jgi:hypothetical protein